MTALNTFHNLIKADIEDFISQHPGFKRILRSFLKTGHYNEARNVDKLMQQGKLIDSFLDFIVSSVERRYEEVTSSTIPGREYTAQFKFCLSDLLLPVVTALFKSEDQQTVLYHLMKSVVILHRGNIHDEIKQVNLHWEAVEVASVYLSSFCTDEFRPQLKKVVPCLKNILGKSSGLKCYISYHYFDDTDTIEEFIVHECAHFFHNIKYKYIGIERRNDEERLVEIAFRNRELFAYSIEFYTRIKFLLSVCEDKSHIKNKLKGQLLAELEDYQIPIHNDNSPDDVRSLVKQALRKRNGWKWLVRECRKVP